MSDKDFSEPQEIVTSHVPPSSLTPVTSDQRINALDILRGFALIGILLMNIEWFGRPISDLGGFNLELSGLDHAVGWLIRCFVEGKFYKLFALLFGMGFAVMLTQAMRKDRPFAAWFTRRMLVLFVFGILHMFLVWQGDILHDYAFAGLLMLGFIFLLRTKRFEKYNNPNSILKIALWWLTVPILLASLMGIGFGVFLDRQSVIEQWQEDQEIRVLVSQLEIKAVEIKEIPTLESSALSEEPVKVSSDEEFDTPLTKEEPDNFADSEDTEPTLQEQAKEIFDEEQEQVQNVVDELAGLKDGSYWQATVFRTTASMEWLLFTPLFALIVLLPIFLLGYWLVISGAIKDHTKHPKLFGYMARIGIGVGLPVTVGSLVIIGHPAVEHIMPIKVVAEVLFTLGQFFMAAGYLGLLIRLLDSPKWYNVLAKLAPMGRMALTNYIMHSVILTSLFYGYAGGMYGEISRAPQMLVVMAIFAIQIPFSSWWLQRYQFGPLEWLWRSLTYKKWQSFKIIPS
jgi:uncharacterized membrane protein YeiB